MLPRKMGKQTTWISQGSVPRMDDGIPARRGENLEDGKQDEGDEQNVRHIGSIADTRGF